MKVYELLTDESKWIQGCLARTEIGHICLSKSTKAVKWCFLGAIRKCYYPGKAYENILKRFYDEMGMGYHTMEWDIIQWNDCPDRIFKDVKELAIKLDI